MINEVGLMMFLEIGLVDPSENEMQVLISGHRGDTGSVLIEALSSAGCACFAHGLDPFPTRLNRVVHAAARHPGAEANDMLVSNVAYLQEVAREAIAHGQSDFIFLSSVSVYSSATAGKIDESSMVSPNDLYGVTKLLGEHYLAKLNLPGVALRLPGILEVKKCSNFMGRLIARLEADEPVEIANGDCLFNAYADPLDIARFVNGTPSMREWQVANFAVRPEWTLTETVHSLRELTRSNSQIQEVPASTGMQLYSIDALTQNFDFAPSHPRDTLEHWLQRRRKAKSS